MSKLVVDANIIISALIASKGKTYSIILTENRELYAPEFIFEEIKKHKQTIKKKAMIDDIDFDLFLDIMSSRVISVPRSYFSDNMLHADAITPDPNDTEYIALAMKMGIPIWSNDKKLKNQDEVLIYNTEELIKVLYG